MNWDKRWNTFYEEGGGNEYPDPAIIRFVARNYYKIKPRSSVNILDLGCGKGANLWYLAREGFSGYGIDGSNASIKHVEEKLNQENLTANLVVGDFIKLPYEENFFDAVIDGASIQHNKLENITKILGEVYRVLKTNGKYFGFFIESDVELSDTRFYTNYFNKQVVKNYFSSFKNLKIDYMSYSERNEEKMIRFLIIEAVKLNSF